MILAPGYATRPFVALLRPAVELTALAFLFTRFGLLAGVAMLFAATTLRSFPLTTNLSAWYPQWALTGLATVLALALYGFFTTLNGRSLGSPKRRPVNSVPV
jgi:hypothetical protein